MLVFFIETGSVTALLGGSDVQDAPTTVVSPSGCSVMVRMTAVMEVMRCLETVPSAMKLEISAVQTTDASPSRYLCYSFSGLNTHLKYLYVKE
jgi:hypothetical protein